MDDSLDIKLHPLKDSTWLEIFPAFNIFYSFFNKNAGRVSERSRDSRDQPFGDEYVIRRRTTKAR